MAIIEYSSRFFKDAVELITELQEHVVSIDPLGYNFIPEGYGIEKIKEYEEQRALVGENSYFKVFKDGDLITGLAIGQMTKIEDGFDYKGRDIFELQELIVSKNSRGKGIGQLFIKDAEDFARSKGISEIQIGVFGTNTKTIDFYKSQGYSERLITMMKVI